MNPKQLKLDLREREPEVEEPEEPQLEDEDEYECPSCVQGHFSRCISVRCINYEGN